MMIVEKKMSSTVAGMMAEAGAVALQARVRAVILTTRVSGRALAQNFEKAQPLSTLQNDEVHMALLIPNIKLPYLQGS